MSAPPSRSRPPPTIPLVRSRASSNYSVYCPFSPTQLRAATDGSAVFVRARSWERDRIIALDMVNNAHHAMRLTDAEEMTWAFDDLFIVVSSEGILAFTPSSSGA